MSTTWFFDGGGTSADCRIMVLSGVGGSDEMWKAFHEPWKAALPELQLDAWHSTDYFRRQNRGAKQNIPNTLLNLIGKQVSQEFSVISFAVDKAAADTVRSNFPD